MNDAPAGYLFQKSYVAGKLICLTTTSSGTILGHFETAEAAAEAAEAHRKSQGTSAPEESK